MTRARLFRFALPAALAAILVFAAGALAQTRNRATMIASPPGGAVAADGASDNVAFSQDNRSAALYAFDSSATNLMQGDTNGKRDIFLVRRATGEGALNGDISRLSVSSRGAEGNGDSAKPSIDGDSRHRPRCIVFESTSSNLDRGDRSADSDVFLRDLRRRRTLLVSEGRSNARNGVVDGECEYVTFESGGRIYVRDLARDKNTQIARGTNPDQTTNGKGVAYERGGQVYYQGFLEKFRSRKKGGPFIKRDGRELLVSATPGGSRGNGPSRNPSLDDNGFYVAFESDATDLCTNTCTGISDDANGTTDVFRRTLSRRAPTKDRMQMVSFSFAVSAQGDGPSNNPAMTGAGENVLFDSAATNLRESPTILLADPNGPVRDIFYWNYPRERLQGNVSRESRSAADRATGQPLNGPSTNPGASNRANYIGWTSTLTGDFGELNGPEIADVFVRWLGGSDEGLPSG